MHTDRKPLRLAVLISGGGSTLDSLIRRIADGRLRNVMIAGVISSRNGAGGVTIAKSASLPVSIVRRKDFLTQAAFSKATTEAVDTFQPDLVIFGGYLCLWTIPDCYLGRVLNIHPALLPKFGGKGMFGQHVHEAVLAAGERESGCTVHLADNEYDHGPVLAQSRVPVLASDTAQTLAERVMGAERELYAQVIQKFADFGVEGLLGTHFKCTEMPLSRRLT